MITVEPFKPLCNHKSYEVYPLTKIEYCLVVIMMTQNLIDAFNHRQRSRPLGKAQNEVVLRDRIQIECTVTFDRVHGEYSLKKSNRQ